MGGGGEGGVSDDQMNPYFCCNMHMVSSEFDISDRNP